MKNALCVRDKNEKESLPQTNVKRVIEFDAGQMHIASLVSPLFAILTKEMTMKMRSAVFVF